VRVKTDGNGCPVPKNGTGRYKFECKFKNKFKDNVKGARPADAGRPLQIQLLAFLLTFDDRVDGLKALRRDQQGEECGDD
jgi:hypothetical protein